MAAFRWYTQYHHLLNWIEGEDKLEEIYLDDDEQILDSGIEFAEIESDSDETTLFQIPENLPILPLRGLVVYPLTAVPLTIGQPRSIKLVDEVVSGERLIGLMAARDIDNETPGPDDLYSVGTLAMVHRLFRAQDGTIRLLVQGLARIRIVEYTQTEPYLMARVEAAPEEPGEGIEIEALTRSVHTQFEQIAEMIPSMPRELTASISAIEDPLTTVYTVANFQRISVEEAQKLLEMDSVEAKLRRMVAILTREREMLELGQKIQNEAKSEIEKMQREYFLREQAKAIQKELGEGDDQTADVEEFRRRIDEANLPPEADKTAHRELDRLSRLPTAAAEYGVIRTYLDWIVSLPWSAVTADNYDIANARQVLNEDHYGLEDVKERILEFLAVRKLRRERQEELSAQERTDFVRREREGVILCFIGPPGVGKTSLGQSIARALNRKFMRISLGGVRDEAEIRGHRRTYIGAMPGRILQSLRRVESKNPVFMLDEIDKLSSDFHGDPSSALLEVLDPEQNVEFRDNYLEVAFDLSQVMFITTANQLETIPGPLLDRMEIIHLAGYTQQEKLNIARNYLVPRQIRENGLRPEEVRINDAGILYVVQHYTREAGVRGLERSIGSVFRKVATRISEGKDGVAEIGPEQVRELLGRPRYFGNDEIERRTEVPGVATGLAWTPVGGEILFIEATRMPGSKSFITTGSVGKVMQESSQAALSYVRSRAAALGIDPAIFEKSDIHLHIPAGATPKDGPSAGVTMATALVSLLTGRTVKADVGMTGEITLRGQVLPIGGIKEKVLAAHRAGLRKVILPRLNEPDLEDIPEEVRREMTFVPVEMVDEVFEASLDAAPLIQPVAGDLPTADGGQ